MNFLFIEKLWTENEIVFVIKIICYTSSLDNIVNFDINYNSTITRLSIITDVIFG
jgi:hypothetical protein